MIKRIMIKRIIRKIIKVIIILIYLTIISQLALISAIDAGIIHEDYHMLLSLITGCINGLILINVV